MTKFTGGVREPEFILHVLPDEKAGIERIMASGAFKAMQFHGWKAWPDGIEPRQLDEDDFDFAFDAPTGTEYLDLAEIAPLSRVAGGYEGSPTTFPRKKLVNAMMSLVQQKGMHYGLGRKLRVHLLLYISDFRFLVSDGVVLLTRLALQRNHYRFASVCFFAPIDAEAGFLQVLYPPPGGVPYVSRDDERRMREETVTNFDPRAWRFDPETGGFFQELPRE